MSLAIFLLVLGTVFLFGVLIIAIAIEAKYADHSAVYELYAIRDRLIALVVFDGVPRDDPWVEGLYDTVNSLLLGARYFSGPQRWSLASATGKAIGETPDKRATPSLPEFEPSEKVKQVMREMQPALQAAASNHVGLILFLSAESRARLKRQRDEARLLQTQINRFGLC